MEGGVMSQHHTQPDVYTETNTIWKRGSIVALVSEPKTIVKPSFSTLETDKSTELAITSPTSEYQVNSCLEWV